MKLRIPLIASLLLLLCMPLLSTAQQKTALTQITKPGRIYPNCQLENYETELTKQFGAEKATAIIERSKQAGWPEAINTTNARMEAGVDAILKKYKVRPVLNIRGAYCLVSVSITDNPGMDAKYFLSSGAPFYILVDKDGVKNPVAPALMLGKSAPKK